MLNPTRAGELAIRSTPKSRPKLKQQNIVLLISLASVQNVFINSYLYSLANRVGATSVWLGTECIKEDSALCVNDDHTLLTYSNFDEGEPRHKFGCVYMSATGSDSAKWSSFKCNQPFEYACEVATEENSPLCPEGYAEHNQLCYRFSSEPAENYDDASTKCGKVPGGTLASIPNYETNQFLAALGIEISYVSNVFIGLRCPKITSNGDASSCYWDDGTSFSFNGFLHSAQTDWPMYTSYPTEVCTFFNNGNWVGTLVCDAALYICKAPLQ